LTLGQGLPKSGGGGGGGDGRVIEKNVCILSTIPLKRSSVSEKQLEIQLSEFTFFFKRSVRRLEFNMAP
jgi:hypothetical protein